MTSEKDLREQLATCTRIFAMQGMIGVFGHVSVYQPGIKRVLITPGMGSDKGNLRPEDMVPTDLDGKPLEGSNGPPVEWPIHTALHGARADALAVAHLHTPYATLFAIAKREFRPVTLQGAIFSDGVPLYPEAQLITTPGPWQQPAKSHRRQARCPAARPRYRRRRAKSSGSSLYFSSPGRRHQENPASGNTGRGRHDQPGRMSHLRRGDRAGTPCPASLELLL